MRLVENIRDYPGFAAGALVTIVVGASIVVFARRIHQHFTRIHERYPPPALLKFFSRPVDLLDLRLCGILVVLMGLFCCYVLFAGTPAATQ